MALSKKAQEALRRAVTEDDAADELQVAIDSGSNPQAAAIAALGVTTALTGVDGTGSNAADLVTTESRLDDIEAKVDAMIAALKLAGLMAT
jgi:hypothetical protein